MCDSTDINCNRTETTTIVKQKFTLDSIMMDLLADQESPEMAKLFIDRMIKFFMPKNKRETDAISAEMGTAMIDYMPIRNLMSFGGIPKEDIEKLLPLLNKSK